MRPIDKVIAEAAIDGPREFEGLAAALYAIRKTALNNGATDEQRVVISFPLIQIARMAAAAAITSEVLEERERQMQQGKVGV